MKIKLEDDSYIEVKTDEDQKLNLIFKTKKDEKTTLILNAKLNADQLNKLVAGLVSQKIKVK